MSNDYYNANSPLSRQTLARASDLNSMMTAIAAGFELLPGKDALNQSRASYYTTGGTANTYTVTMSPTLLAYAAGLRLTLNMNATNTGSSTVNVNGLGAKAILRVDGTNVEAGDLTSGELVDVAYNGTSFTLLSPARSLQTLAATTLGADLVFSGDPAFTGSPDFSGVDNASTIRTDLGVAYAIGTSANGFYLRMPSSTQICTHTLTLSYASASSVSATWTYPATFASTPIIIPVYNRTSLAADATPTDADVGASSAGVVTTTSASIKLNRVTGQTNFQSGDTVDCNLLAVGDWS